MPTVLRSGPYRFYFYSYDCGEPRHMHVDRENRSTKFWLGPYVLLEANYGYSGTAAKSCVKSSALCVRIWSFET